MSYITFIDEKDFFEHNFGESGFISPNYHRLNKDKSWEIDFINSNFNLCKINDEEDRIIGDYTVSEDIKKTDYNYKKINSSLNSGKELPEDIKKIVSIITSIIKRSYVKNSIRVYRGISFDKEIMMQIGLFDDNLNFKKEGSIVNFKGFTSCSLDLETAFIMSNKCKDYKIVFAINIEKGDNCFYIKNSYHSNEHEVLIEPNSDFVITGPILRKFSNFYFITLNKIKKSWFNM